MHLTNYSLNKKSPDFIKNDDAGKDDVGHKRSLTFILKVILKVFLNFLVFKIQRKKL